MKSFKFILTLYSVLIINHVAKSQEFANNCNIESYVFIDSLTIQENLIDQRKAGKYMFNRNKKSSYFLITNEDEYKLFKTSDAMSIDFERYNVFVSFFNSHGDCYVTSIPIKFSLLFDKLNDLNIVSIVQTIYLPHLRMNCPDYFITAIIPKKYSDKICHTLKYVKITQNEN